MSDAILIYNGTTQNGDPNNTANAYVKRNADKSVNVGQVNSSGTLNGNGLVITGKAASASATLDTTAGNIEVDATAAIVNLTLPPVATCADQIFELIKIDSSGHAANFVPNGAELINGANSALGTSTQWATVKIKANHAGTAWYSW